MSCGRVSPMTFRVNICGALMSSVVVATVAKWGAKGPVTLLDSCSWALSGAFTPQRSATLALPPWKSSTETAEGAESNELRTGKTVVVAFLMAMLSTLPESGP